MTCPIFTATSPVWIRRMNKENRQHPLAGEGILTQIFFTQHRAVSATNLAHPIGIQQS
jgi:hypothetical protein